MDEGESLLGELGLEKLIVGAGEEFTLGAGDGRNEVVDRDGLAVKGALFVAVGGDLDRQDGGRLDGAIFSRGLLGEDGPQAGPGVGGGVREIEKDLESTGIEVGEQNGGGMELEAGGGGAAVVGDVEQVLGGISGGREVDGRAIDGGADLRVAEVACRGELLRFREGVFEALH